MLDETIHPQVRIQFGSCIAYVDKELAALILECWKAQIDTMSSCQEQEPGFAYLSFCSVADASHFVNLVAPHEEERWEAGDFDTVWNRATAEGSVEGSWEWRTHLVDLSNELDEEADEVVVTGPMRAHFELGVLFPRSDIPLLVERLQAPPPRRE